MNQLVGFPKIQTSPLPEICVCRCDLIPMLRRTLHIGILLVLASVAVVATIHIQQRILRFRAERLLSDIRALDVLGPE